MMCGSKCFLVEMELNGTKQIKQVTAKTFVGARKVIRGKYGAEVEILSVKEKKSHVE
jgi:hypothetical protein